MVPTQDYRRTDYRAPARPLKGLDALMNSMVGRRRRRLRVREQLQRDAAAIDAQAQQWLELSDHDLQTRLLQFRESFRRGG
ncbi:MAG: hypothetical protein QOJ40_2285, partial [Verrucomicrobiota bacterium]